jgi:hypothetical protein
MLVPTTPKGPVRLGFPIDVLERWLPNLYPGDLIALDYPMSRKIPVER